MNIRALILFAAALLMQVGQGIALVGDSDRTDGHEIDCTLGCCAGMDDCRCAEAPGSDHLPQTPAPFPVSGRELVPQPVMMVETEASPMARSARVLDETSFRPVAPRSDADPAVSLTVLHCAFLI